MREDVTSLACFSLSEQTSERIVGYFTVTSATFTAPAPWIQSGGLYLCRTFGRISRIRLDVWREIQDELAGLQTPNCQKETEAAAAEEKQRRRGFK